MRVDECFFCVTHGNRYMPDSSEIYSDNVPIMGYRRKPYMLGGWFLASASQLALLSFSDMNLDASGTGCFADAGENVDPIVPSDAPSGRFLVLIYHSQEVTCVQRCPDFLICAFRRDFLLSISSTFLCVMSLFFWDWILAGGCNG